MRILMLSQWFEPEPTLKGLVFARELARRGHQVEVLTGFPNYPGGKLYPGYRIRPWTREVMDGVPVNRVALYPSHDRSSCRRVANYVSFATSAALLGPLLAHKPDIIHVHNLVTLSPAASLLRCLRGGEVVYDIQDLWPESVAVSGMLHGRRVLRMLEYLCNRAYRAAEHVVTLSPGVKDALLRRGLPADRVTTIYNWCDERSMHPFPRDTSLAEALGLAGTFNVMFAGNMGSVQALDAVLEAAVLLASAHPRIRFVFVGAGIDRDRLASIARDRGLSGVVFLPRQPLEAMGPILALADLMLVHLKDDPLFRITIPSKTQAYLAVGRPILMAVRGDAARLLERSGGGVVCQPEDPESIAEGVLRVYGLSEDERAAMGRAGRSFYERELSLQAGVDRFESCFQRVLAQRRVRAY
ncbi:MAG: glycosyltransferase family 4 protein [Anaerolineae bacterium]